MLVGVDQRLDIVDIVLGQHIVTLAESEGPHNVVCQVREPSRHVLIRAAERVWVLNLLAKESDLVDDGRLVGAQSGLTHSMGNDPSLASMNSLIDGAGDILQRLSEHEVGGLTREYTPRVTASPLVRVCSTWPEQRS